ncbi:lactonase family protein [Bacillus sp. Xin]|uniref:lactonase family protein n=1 Tax=unclassified Bacillus (in: firmicutes) TaxID=185979 RepID=UPI001572D229|nr:MULTISPECIES: lactonase family protein [unclassified Bacillus (in: firmicutes)]MBC6974792.1 lactonase family protein [Bacillus sp. Xin]NSW37104.1 lactonase family protein [Bacillus sp. Xin1]
MNNGKLLGYIGTYTRGDSEGIYKFTLDTQTATIEEVSIAAKLNNPTYLAISEDNQFLYSVIKKGESGGVAAFSINHHTNSLETLNSQILDGASPCHVGIDKTNQMVVTANYHKGTIESYIVNKESGALDSATSIIEHKGSGPNKERQEKAHTHYAGFTPDYKYVVAVDLGIDQLITYKVSRGILTEVNRLSVQPGSGPRHLVFHPNGRYVYTMTELSSQVITLTYNAENGEFKEVQYISTIPDEFKENNQGSAIHISSDGRFVYAANRGHNSVAIFSVNQDTGELTFVESVYTEGDWPRDFILDPTEKFLIVINERTSNLVLFSRDESLGKLKLLQSDVVVPDPVCIKFLNI